MLHRMALRVLPSLSLAVTEAAVRKKKRIVMFAPGMVAFGCYRLAKHLLPLSEPWVLLLACGVLGLVTSLASYRVGRASDWRAIGEQDGARLLMWMTGWIGFAYGIQLSLLVLALLWLVGYDYLQHPDGPAMMAMIISCTAVARDAFEIGHVRKMQIMGRPFTTFPNGAPLRELVGSRSALWAPWVAAGVVAGALGASLGHLVQTDQIALIVQLAGVTLVGGTIALCAYLSGMRPQVSWTAGLLDTKVSESLKYWWWPGMAFASTYYLVAAGVVIFVAREPGVPTWCAAVAGGMVAALMGLYGYYLGHRRRIEDQQAPEVSAAMLRCPFVMGILGKSGAGASLAAPSTSKV
ncbi:MAG: conserved membrane protein of unknown function [Nitrospira sp.]